MMEGIYYCPKCESENVETIWLNPPERISMDEMATSTGGRIYFNYLVYKTKQYQIVCKDCGYSVDFSI